MNFTTSFARALRRLGAAGLLLLAVPALAHVADGATGTGFRSGLMHPVLGWDHLLAMVCVGLWGAVLGRPLLLALPVVFPLLMLAGAALGLAGVPLPRVETGIATSVLVLGAAVLAAWRAPMGAALVLIGLFGVLHGHAHGTELPQSADPAAYAAGFLLATGLLHLAGIAIGAWWSTPRGRVLVRALGALVAAAGSWLLLGSVLAT